MHREGDMVIAEHDLKFLPADAVRLGPLLVVLSTKPQQDLINIVSTSHSAKTAIDVRTW